MKTLVILESNRGTLHRLSREAIVAAQNLGGEVSALAIGKDADIIASEVENVQLKEVLVVKNKFVESYSADGFTEIISQVILHESPENIMLGHTYQTRDFAPRLSAKLDIPFLPDIVSAQDGKFIKQVLNAKLNASVLPLKEQKIISFQSAAYSDEHLILGRSSIRE